LRSHTLAACNGFCCILRHSKAHFAVCFCACVSFSLFACSPPRSGVQLPRGRCRPPGRAQQLPRGATGTPGTGLQRGPHKLHGLHRSPTSWTPARCASPAWQALTGQTIRGGQPAGQRLDQVNYGETSQLAWGGARDEPREIPDACHLVVQASSSEEGTLSLATPTASTIQQLTATATATATVAATAAATASARQEHKRRPPTTAPPNAPPNAPPTAHHGITISREQAVEKQRAPTPPSLPLPRGSPLPPMAPAPAIAHSMPLLRHPAGAPAASTQPSHPVLLLGLRSALRARLPVHHSMPLLRPANSSLPDPYTAGTPCSLRCTASRPVWRHARGAASPRPICRVPPTGEGHSGRAVHPGARRPRRWHRGAPVGGLLGRAQGPRRRRGRPPVRPRCAPGAPRAWPRAGVARRGPGAGAPGVHGMQPCGRAGVGLLPAHPAVYLRVYLAVHRGCTYRFSQPKVGRAV